jgi:hypothetical protein
MKKSARETAFALILTLIFLAAAGFVLSRHEIWRDEAQAWLLAKDSRSLDDLALRMKFDGHQALWYWGLFALSRFTASPAAMQILHLLIAAAAVFLFARFAPFPRAARILFAFSYYAFYEYGVISRNYGVGMLMLFFACAVWKRRRRSLLLPALALLLLAQTNTTMVIPAVAIAIVLAGEALILRKEGRPRFLVFAAVVVLIGLGVGLYQAMPDSSSTYAKSIDVEVQPQKAYYIYRLIGKAFLTVPDPKPHFWGTSILRRYPSAPITTPLLSGLILLFALIALIDRPRALAFGVMAVGALCVFFYVAYLGYIRHHGSLFLVFLAAMWMAAEEKAAPWGGGWLRRAARWGRKAAPAVVTGLLLIQTAATAIAAAYDVRLPFSQGKRAAAYIRARGLGDRVIVGDVPFAMSPLSAYLDAPIYAPRLERWTTYTPWIEAARRNTGMTEIVAAAERLSRETGREYLIALNYPLNEGSLRTRRLRRVAAFGGAIVGDESFYLYRRDKR